MANKVLGLPQPNFRSPRDDKVFSRPFEQTTR